MMVGREVSLTTQKEPAQPGEPALQIQGLTVLSSTGKVTLDNVTLDVRAGEILAVAGVDGNGQTELTETILGARQPASGDILLNGTSLRARSIKERLNAGLGFVPEDRSTDGVIAGFSITENFVLDMYDQPPYASG